MKKAIWGTGLYASKLAFKLKDEIDFFIDNNKKQSYYLGKPIFHPNEVASWKDIYIYIPYNYYDDIVNQLSCYGVYNLVGFEKYYEVNTLTGAQFEKNYNEALEQIKDCADKMKNSILFWGALWSFDRKGYQDYIRTLCKKNKYIRWGLISEAIWYSQEETEQIMGMPAIVTPAIFDDRLYLEQAHLTKEQELYLKDKKNVYFGIEYLKNLFPKISEDEAAYMVYFIYHYVNRVVDLINPKLIIVCALFSLQHIILEEICVEKNVPLISTHPGVLPGTFSFDIGGEMGRSLPAVYSEKFVHLSVSKTELEQAKAVWQYLFESKLNRKIQINNSGVDYVRDRLEPGKPVVFYAAQNDINSEMVPYTEKTQKYHSPIFKSSKEAGIYLARLCEKNGWNFVYKPHPMTMRYENTDKLPSNTIYIENGNINDLIDISDVVITILSQTNYISLIRHKPVVMLGYNQTRGKGCTYEAFKMELIEDTIKTALKQGFTKNQEESFVRHIAQLLKYYLYDDGLERNLRFGRDIPENIEEFYELEQLLN